jgi:cytochrome c peroxidase
MPDLKYRSLILDTIAVVLCALSSLCKAASSNPLPHFQLGLPPPPVTQESNRIVVELGRQLFFDRRLSADGKVSCGTCHIPRFAFTDSRARSVGNHLQTGTRNAPSLLNVVFLSSFFWDGRASDLETQVEAPLTNPLEFALHSASDVVAPIRGDSKYVREFFKGFGVTEKDITSKLVARAISAYERTLLSGGSPFDRYQYGHDSGAMSAEAIRGLSIFQDRGKCSTCHSLGEGSALFTDGQFHMSPTGLSAAVAAHLSELTNKVVNTAKTGNAQDLDRLIATDSGVAALGRFVITRKPTDIGQFKTPSLRNVALTAPYMHDGSVITLERAVDLELYGRESSLNYPIALTVDEKRDLLSFLKSLTGTVGEIATRRQ